VGAWYWIGVSTGLGAAAGVLLAGATSGGRGERVAVVLLAGAAGAGIGWGIQGWQPGGWGDRLAGIAGGVAGALGAAQTVGGALRRGGTRLGTMALVGAAAVVVAGVAWIPAAGYLVAVGLLALSALLKRARPERYAGLRTLARDE
jgi:hypothetical protein